MQKLMYQNLKMVLKNVFGTLFVEKSCELLPAKYNERCHSMMEIYGDSVIHLIEEFGTKGVCQKIGLCSSSDAAYVHMYREKRN